jgi:hypothetical protein
MTANDGMIDYLFGGNKPTLDPELETDFAGWLRGSRRFRTFAADYRDKIRAKLKNVRDESGIKSVRAELEIAVLLLREERFTIEYEKYAASKQRGPDFTVTFKTHTPFNVEVRRIHSMEIDASDAEVSKGKLMTVLCEKVGQMPPSIINLLWFVTDHEISEADLTQAIVTLRQLAEGKTEDYFTRRGFGSAADFLKHFRQLSGIILRKSNKQPDELLDNHAPMLWLNSLARHKVLPGIVTAIQRLEDF